MTRYKRVAALIAILSISACGQQDDTPDAGGTDSPASAATCPQPNADGTVEIRDGLVAAITKSGYGRAAQSRDYADVHTTLWLYDESAEGGRGTEIWSSGGAQPL